MKPMRLEPNINEIVSLPLEQLLLDAKNPRLAWRAGSTGIKQEDLIEALWVEMSVDEVAWSIAENGFFPSEPLFVIINNPEVTDLQERRYVVVEGNRQVVGRRIQQGTDADGEV